MNEFFKICICYHKPAFLFKQSCFLPIWCGKAVANAVSKEGTALSEQQIRWMEENCIGDDTGDNISKENRKYSEATALYWVWKNYEKTGNPKYIGFMQYRRYFLFGADNFKGALADCSNQIYIDAMPKNYAETMGLNCYQIESILKNYDGIVACNDTKQSIRFYNEHHFSQDIKYYNKTLEIIDKDWQKIAPCAHQYEHETYHSWSQCFVVSKEVFFDYCTFLFDVLKKLDEVYNDDYQHLSVEQQRILGYAAENLWGIYWRYLTNKGLKFKCVPLVFNNNPFIKV
ncbi:MAG: DUF4422 domain-containing protein [Alphaproteobacteria bacterium]|nr:DUF4422 domain-containing protein [Alphaproteobacteria bacterium]